MSVFSFCAVLFYRSSVLSCLDAPRTDLVTRAVGECCPLEINLTTSLTGGVKLRSTNTVAVPATNL